MPGTWTEFKRAFKSNVDAQLRRIEGTLTELHLEETRLQQIITTSQDPEAVREATEALYNQLKIIRGVEANRQRKELQRLIEARAAYDKQSLDELTGEDGPLLRVGADVEQAREALQGASDELGSKRSAAETATQELEAHLLTYPDLKRLLEAMKTAETAAGLKATALDAADRGVSEAQATLKVADQRVIDLAEGREAPSDADAIVTQFTTATTTLSQARAAQKTAFDQNRKAAKALEDAVKALEDAIVNKLKAVSPPERLPKDNQLLALFAAMKAARHAAEVALSKKEQAEETLGQQEHQLQRITERAELLSKRADLYREGLALRQQLSVPPLNTVVVWQGSVSDLKARIGEARFQAVAEKGYSVMMRLEELSRLGLTRDEVVEFYEDLQWPENWQPPFMRAQEQNWVAVRQLISDEDVGSAQETTKGALATLGIAVEESYESTLEAVAGGLEGLGEIIGEDRLGDAAKWVTAFSAIFTLGTEGKKALEALRTGSDGVDPVEQLMVIDDQISAIGRTCGSLLGAAKDVLDLPFIETVTDLVPGLGAVQDFGNLCAHAVAATEAWMKASADAEVHQKALAQKHRAEAATDMVQRRMKHKGARASVDAATDLISFCGQIATLTGAGAVAGVVLSTTSSVVSGVSTAAAFIIDTNTAQEAKTLLQQARAGNPEARESIFRYHGRYACALIAILAEEGDPIALSIYTNHNVTVAMVQKSSAKVLKKYLMREIEADDDPTSWDDIREWFVKAGKAIAGFFSSAGDAVKDLAQRVQPFFLREPTDKQLAEAELAVLKAGMDSLSAVQRGVQDLVEARDRYAAQKRRVDAMASTDAARPKALAALKAFEDKVTELDGAVTTCRQKVTETLSAAAGLIVRMDKGPAAGGPQPAVFAKIGEGSKRRFKALIDEQRRCLTLLAQAT